MFYVYVIRNPQGILYKGQTREVQKRFAEHNASDGPCSYTRNKGPWELVYQETCATRADAMIREKFFKTGAGRDFLKNKLQEG